MSEVYKLVVGKALEMDEIDALAAAAPAATEATAESRGVELQRIDRTEGATVIFVASSRQGVEGFARALEAGGVKARVERSSEKELQFRDPVKG